MALSDVERAAVAARLAMLAERLDAIRVRIGVVTSMIGVRGPERAAQARQG
jgi:hypothetical protein